jgi:hypothetical protein
MMAGPKRQMAFTFTEPVRDCEQPLLDLIPEAFEPCPGYTSCH